VADVEWSFVVRAAVIATAISVCLLCAVVKLMMLSYQHWLAGYYIDHERDEEDSKTCLPNCPIEEQMNMACMNLRYSLTKPLMRSRSHQLRNRSSSFFSTQTHIVNNISAYFNSGELVAVMGPSGCGKTTFLDVLMGRRDEGTTEV
jgi:ABC-type transport system involved in cytochrome bd biosynthesis fused ATPase/permease subunit